MDLNLHQLPEEAAHHQREFGNSPVPALDDTHMRPLPSGLPDGAQGQAVATSPLSSALKVMR